MCGKDEFKILRVGAGGEDVVGGKRLFYHIDFFISPSYLIN